MFIFDKGKSYKTYLEVAEKCVSEGEHIRILTFFPYMSYEMAKDIFDKLHELYPDKNISITAPNAGFGGDGEEYGLVVHNEGE